MDPSPIDPSSLLTKASLPDETHFDPPPYPLTSLLYTPSLLSFPQNTIASPSNSPSPFYLLSHHQDRLLATCDALSIPLAAESPNDQSGLLDLEKPLRNHLSATYSDLDSEEIGPLKIRITITPPAGHLTITSSPILPPALSALFPPSLPPTPTTPQTWTIFLSPTHHPIPPSLLTRHKTTSRNLYNELRALLPPPPPLPSPFPSPTPLPHEILVHNPLSQISEATLSTPYFLRNGVWITPSLHCGGNDGTTRRWALANGLCEEGIVAKETVRRGEVVWLSNGVRGWGWGVVEGEVGE